MITRHALSRYIERANVTSNEAVADMINTIQPNRHKIKEALKFMDTVRMPLSNNLIAIVILGKNKRIIIKTVRKRKWN